MFQACLYAVMYRGFMTVYRWAQRVFFVCSILLGMGERAGLQLWRVSSAGGTFCAGRVLVIGAGI